MGYSVVTQFPANIGPLVGIDIETTSMPDRKRSISNPYENRIVAITISNGDHTWICWQESGFLSLAPILENKECVKIFHNAAFDLQFLLHYLKPTIDKRTVWDTLLAERLMHAGDDIYVRHRLEDVLARQLGVMINKETRATFADQRGELSAEQLTYVEGDAKYLPQLYRKQQEQIALPEMALGRVMALENRIVLPVTRMGLRGVGFDLDWWDMTMELVQAKVKAATSALQPLLVGPKALNLFSDDYHSEVNLNSDSQVLRQLQALGADVDCTNEETLNVFRKRNPDHPAVLFINGLLHYRRYAHMASWGYPNYINPATGRIHAQWNQIEAATGRFSCSKPNLQNVPRREPGEPDFRRLFLPSRGHKFIIADYSQQEPRVLAQLSGDPQLQQICSEADVYMGLAAAFFHKPIQRGDPERDIFKTRFLASVYGAAPSTLADRSSATQEEMDAFQSQMFRQFPMVEQYMTRVKLMATHKGITRSLLGRLRHYPASPEGRLNRHMLNQAMNMPIQASGADMLKLAIDHFDDVCQERGYHAHIVMQIHDELVVEAPEAEAEEVYYQLLGCFEQAGQELCPDVKITAEGVISDHWEKT